MPLECKLEAHQEVWDLTGTLTGEMFGPTGELCSAVHENQNLKIKLKLELFGHILNYLCNTQIGVELAFESCGSGAEGEWCKWSEVKPCTPGGNTLEFEFDIPGGVLKSGQCGKQYEICITVGSKDCCGEVGVIFGKCKHFSITVLPAHNP